MEKIIGNGIFYEYPENVSKNMENEFYDTLNVDSIMKYTNSIIPLRTEYILNELIIYYQDINEHDINPIYINLNDIYDNKIYLNSILLLFSKIKNENKFGLNRDKIIKANIFFNLKNFNFLQNELYIIANQKDNEHLKIAFKYVKN